MSRFDDAVDRWFDRLARRRAAKAEAMTRCRVCGTLLDPPHDELRWCSDECRDEWMIRHY